MKKVLIIPSNTDLNRGDQALVWETKRIIEDLYSPEKVEITAIESGFDFEIVKQQSYQSLKQGYSLCSPIIKHPGRHCSKDSSEHMGNGISRMFKWGIVALLDFSKSILLLSRCKFVNRIGAALLTDKARHTLQLIQNADSIFVKGGGFIHAFGKITDTYQMYYSTFSMLLAKRYDKKVFVMPNSFGPLNDKISRRFITKLLNRCEFVAAREDISFRYLQEILKIPCVKYPDLGYYLEDKSGINEKKYLRKAILSGKPIVGITLRPWRFPDATNPEEKYKSYITSLVEFIRYLNSKGYYACLFAHTLGPSAHENDALAIKDVTSKLGKDNDYEIVKDYQLNCYDMMKLYSKCSYFIGTRFHSVIFAQNQNVPTIAISYGGNKGNGIMGDLGFSEFVISISSVNTATLSSAFEKLEQSARTYKEALIAHKTKLLRARESMIQALKPLV